MQDTFLFGFTVDDVGLDGYSSPQHLDNLLDFCREMGLKSTFFVVPETPEGLPIGRRDDYVALLKRALRDGHEVAQHGIQHDRFELGVPPRMVLDLPHEGPAREFLNNNRERLAREHTVANLRRKLRYGREVLEAALGETVMGFRSPALQSCENMFIALAEEGYLYDSSVALQESGWDLIVGKTDAPARPITRERFAGAQREPGLLELPLTTDYTWYLEQDRYRATLDLARHDFAQCRLAGIPLVSVCHVSPIHEGRCGFTLLREWIGFMRETAAGEGFAMAGKTLSDIAHDVGPNAPGSMGQVQ